MGSKRLFGSSLLLGILLAALRTQAQLGAIQQGVATFYGGPQDNTSPNVASFGVLKGSCGYGALMRNQWPYWQATAIAPANPLYSSGNQKGCGACIQATCTSGCVANASSLLVLVTDTCDTCATNQLNIHASAFAAHFQSDLTVGQVMVQWQQVNCNPPGNIIAEVVDSRQTDGGFLAVALLEVAGNGVIKNLEYMGQGSSSWTPMRNDYGAVWQASNFGSPPFSLRITGGSGEVLIAMGVITQASNGQYQTGVQFGGSGTSGPPPSRSPVGPPPQSAGAPPPRSPAGPLTPPPAPFRAAVPTLSSGTSGSPPPASNNRSAPAPAPVAFPQTTAVSTSRANGTASNATAPIPSAFQSRGPQIAPSAFTSTAPSPAVQVPTMAPDETQLTVSSNLSGSIASAANSVVNPTISIAGRRLQGA